MSTSELCIWKKNKSLQWMTLVVLSTIPKHWLSSAESEYRPQDYESKRCFWKQSLHRRPRVRVNQCVSTLKRCFLKQSLQRRQRVTLVVVLRKQPWLPCAEDPAGNGDDFIQLSSAWRQVLWKGSDATFGFLHLTIYSRFTSALLAHCAPFQENLSQKAAEGCLRVWVCCIMNHRNLVSC